MGCCSGMLPAETLRSARYQQSLLKSLPHFMLTYTWWTSHLQILAQRIICTVVNRGRLASVYRLPSPAACEHLTRDALTPAWANETEGGIFSWTRRKITSVSHTSVEQRCGAVCDKKLDTRHYWGEKVTIEAKG